MSNHLSLLRTEYVALMDLHKAAKGFRYGTSADHYFDEQSRRWKRREPKKRKAKGSRGQTSPQGHSPHGAHMGTNIQIEALLNSYYTHDARKALREDGSYQVSWPTRYDRHGDLKEDPVEDLREEVEALGWSIAWTGDGNGDEEDFVIAPPIA